jgi:hypothetical protein
MLEYLRLKNVGPAPEMEMLLAPRVNLITGDNGLGKSFLLDVAWWALTRTWARGMVLPHAPPDVPEMAYHYRAKSKSVTHTSHFNRETQHWSVKQSRPGIPGLVLYAQVDGGFSVWDPARNYSRKESPDRPTSFLFTAQEVWEGNALCEGLIRDWASWQREASSAFAQLHSVLHALSPSPTERLAVGDLRKIFLDDPRRYPTLKMPYGQEVAVIHASAGMRRIIALAYLLVWAWQEHLAACQLLGGAPTREVIFLIDEVDAHLYPQWQRRIVPAILDVMDALTGQHTSNVQLIATTHSPLVLASMETRFDPEQDAWFDLDLVGDPQRVVLKKREFVRRGDVSNWLTSDAFDLKEARSLDAEEAITQALALARMSAPSQEEIDRVDRLLSRALSDVDRFWLRWSAFRENVEAPR